jgi:hypothetical protein
MESAMPRIHIVAILLSLSGITATQASAQTATAQAPGQPLQLLRLLHFASQPNKPKTKPYFATHSAVRKAAHRTVAKADGTQAPMQTAMAPALDSAWPAVNPNPATSIAAADAPSPAASSAADFAIGQLVVGGETVKIASPEDVNEIDLDAGAQPNSGVSGNAETAAAAMGDTDAAPKSDSLTAHPQPSLVGSASWIAQVLAALGGAVAAGSAAWFLIGAAPQRTYG